MIPPSPAFVRYVEAARRGRTAFWRILVGAALVEIVYLSWTLAILIAALALDERTGPKTYDMFVSPLGTAFTLAVFFGMWHGVRMAARRLQHRDLRSVLGADGRISSRSFARGLAAVLIPSLIVEFAWIIAAPPTRSAISLNEWLLWLAPIGALIAVQTSAEEVLYRGYLPQALAARFRSPLIWGLIPGALFTALHWVDGASLWMNLSIMIAVGAFALAATILLYLTGDLGAAMGVHFGWNLVSFLLYAPGEWGDAAGLFVERSLTSPDWTIAEIMTLALSEIAITGSALLLLLEDRSPLRIVEPS